MKIGVVIPAFGDWYIRKSADAVDSVMGLVVPDGVEVVWQVIEVVDNVSVARNQGAKHMLAKDADWLIFLDADDLLDPGYVEKALPYMDLVDLIQPATCGFYPDGSTDEEPNLIEPARSFLQRNHIVIGAPVRASLFEEVGGFNDLPVLEDWDLWIRVMLAGGVVYESPGSIYWVGVNPKGRNLVGQGGGSADHRSTYSHIRSQTSTRLLKLDRL